MKEEVFAMSIMKLVRNVILAVVAIAVLVVVALVGYNAMNNTASANQAEQTVNTQAQTDPTQEPAPVVTTAPAASATTIPVEETEAYQALLAMYQQAVADADAAKAEADAAEATPVVTEVPVTTTPAPVQDVVPQAPVLVVDTTEEEQEEATTVATAPVQDTTIRSSELDLIGETKKGQPFTYAIYSTDLSKVQYKEIKVDEWNGITVARNTEGIICQIWSRETEGAGKSANKAVSEKKAQAFFNEDGTLKKANAREGWWNGKGNAVATMKLNDQPRQHV